MKPNLRLFSCSSLLCIFFITQPTHISASSSSASAPVRTDLEPINGTLNYRIYGKKGKDDKPWFDGRGLDRHIQCVRRGRCEKLTFNTCLGAKIPYEYTSLDLTDYQRQEQVVERLNNYRALRHVPKCWAVIQPFLCSVFAPKCEPINGQDMIYLPSLEMCRITLEPCRLLYNTTYFPEFLRCNETLFPPKCNNDVREMKFNVSGSCLEPLVAADSAASYYPGIEGCGVQCKDPLYTDDEQRQIHKLIAWCCTLCLLANAFVVATFFIDWDNASKYPSLIVFYINLCFLIACLGWLAQFTPGSREDIVCRKDGTVRQSEPTAGQNLSCIVVFVLVYYFLMAAMVWFVFLTYTWHLRAVGNFQDRIDKMGSYFHLVAWSLPLVLTITTMALSEVDGNSTVGICFVGYLNHPMRAGVLLGPLCGIILVGVSFISMGMVKLFRLKRYANEKLTTSASKKLHWIIVRMSVCAVFTLIFFSVAIACHVTEFMNSSEWAVSLRKFIICRISSTFTDEHIVCKIENRPSVAILQLHLLCLFGAGILMSTWCWTPSSLETWKRYFRKKCGKDVVEEVKMPKHKVIAQTYAKRKEFEDKGRLSITLCNTYTDPVGLNFDVKDLNDSETNEISSTWANYLPQFVKRRMALTGAGTTNSSSQGPRKNSLDSEINISVRHVSVESRRNSVDSQVSVKIAEMKTKVASRSRNHHHHQSKHVSSAISKRSQRRRDFIASAPGRKNGGRRESSTSMESQIIALKKTTYPNSSHKVDLFAQSTKKHNSSSGGKNMRRRSANAGLDPADIREFLAKNPFITPFLKNPGMTTWSDDEVSSTSCKMDLSDDENDDDDNDIFNHNSGARIEEIHDTTQHERNSKKQAALENLLKNMQKSHESSNRNSRNSTRSRQSRNKALSNATNCRRSQRGGNNNNGSRKHKSTSLPMHSNKVDLLNISDLNLHFTCNDDDSISSYSSAELDIPLSAMLQHSSYSSNDKPNSRNSKTSCDVGIQANAYEIATQTLASYGGDDELKMVMRHLNAKNRRKSDYADDADGDGTEMQSLINNNKHREAMIMSESEKLKMLLLPSK